jgi:hydrogenase expression/formation protein HypC
MCIGIPMRVDEPHGAFAWCTGRDGRALVDLTLVGAQPAGTWLFTFLGVARDVLTAEAAQRIDRALDGLASVIAGDDSRIEEAFADLVDRVPELPEHLRRKESAP